MVENGATLELTFKEALSVADNPNFAPTTEEVAEGTGLELKEENKEEEQPEQPEQPEEAATEKQEEEAVPEAEEVTTPKKAKHARHR